jgi:hypothetical protein
MFAVETTGQAEEGVKVSAATRERGSWAKIASRIASEIWSATLSG